MSALRVLLLGGTSEANALASMLGALGIATVYSYAGRVAQPRPQPVDTRVGGFGGVAGLIAYLKDNEVTHVVDATHPFAARMSHNALCACAEIGLPLAALTRASWEPGPGDRWHRVADMAAAAAALDGPRRRVFLAIGRQELGAFRDPRHFYLLRLVDPPGPGVDLPPGADWVVARGPFDLAGDQALLAQFGIDTLVTKNAGGQGARAKLVAARDRGAEVIMIDRPELPAGTEMHDPAAVLDWLAHGDDLGV